MKVNRVLELLFILLDGKRHTAQALASYFGVVKKTIHRDIDFLVACQIPIKGKKGLNGGYYIEDRSDLLTGELSESEKNEFRKVIESHNALSKDQLKEILDLVQSKFTDYDLSTTWIDVTNLSERERYMFNKLKQAIIKSKRVRLFFYEHYVDVTPIQILIDAGESYLIFFIEIKSKTFKVSLTQFSNLYHLPN